MKINDRTRQVQRAKPLSSFNRGDCIRLVDVVNGNSRDETWLGELYILAAVGGEKRLAINFSNGCYRSTGLFVLEPNAKVVIE